MKALMRAALAACVAVVAAAGPANAAQVFLYGKAVEDSGSNVVSDWTLAVTYTEVPPGGTDIAAPITAAVLTIDRLGTIYTWNTPKSDSLTRIRIAEGLTSYTLSVDFDGGASTPAGATTGTTRSELNMVIGGATPVGAQVATQANVDLLTSTATVINGTFRISPEAPFNTFTLLPLAGFASVPVPEPGSVMLLSGLGLVAGRRVIARRRQKKAEKAEAAA